jgi:hypothetical protein
MLDAATASVASITARATDATVAWETLESGTAQFDNATGAATTAAATLSTRAAGGLIVRNGCVGHGQCRAAE